MFVQQENLSENRTTQEAGLEPLEQVWIESGEDVGRLRTVTRRVLNDLDAELPDQARISWLANYLGRQIMQLNGTGSISLNVAEREDGQGLVISCEGAWLRGVGHLYKMHMIPSMSKQDEVDFDSGRYPRLTITTWLS